MELLITPALCKESKSESGEDVAPLFSGTVTVRTHSMPESYRFKAKLGEKSSEMTAASENKGKQAAVAMRLLADAAEEIKGCFVAVDLKELSTGVEIKSADDLYSYEPAFGIISEIAMKFVQGFAEKK